MQYHSGRQKKADHTWFAYRSSSLGGDCVCRSGCHGPAGTAGRQEGIQSRLLQHRNFCCIHTYWSWRWPDYRLHRRRRGVYHRACPHECRHQRYFGRGNRPFPHFCQGNHGKRDPQKVGERLCPLGGCFPDRGYYRSDVGRADQPRPLRDQSGTQ